LVETRGWPGIHAVRQSGGAQAIRKIGSTCPLLNVYEAFAQPGRIAPQLVYSQGLDLANPDGAVPIGMGCKVCERAACPHRAFPPIGRALDVNENRSRFAPYPVAAPMAATGDAG